MSTDIHPESGGRTQKRTVSLSRGECRREFGGMGYQVALSECEQSPRIGEGLQPEFLI